MKSELLSSCPAMIMVFNIIIIVIMMVLLRGGTLIFSYIRRLGPIWGFKILNFNTFGGFQKNKYILGYEDFFIFLNDNIPSTSSNDTQTHQRMIVKFKKRISRPVAREKRHTQKLKYLNESLERKNASLRKRYSRPDQKCKTIAC